MMIYMTITEEQLDEATAIIRQAGTGTMVRKGKVITPTMLRQAQRTYAQWLEERPAR